MLKKLLVMVAAAIMLAFATADVTAQTVTLKSTGAGQVTVLCNGVPCDKTPPVSGSPRRGPIRRSGGSTTTTTKDGDTINNYNTIYEVVDDDGNVDFKAELDEIINQQKLGRAENRAGFTAMAKIGSNIYGELVNTHQDMVDGFGYLGQKLDQGNYIAAQQLKVANSQLKWQKAETVGTYLNLGAQVFFGIRNHPEQSINYFIQQVVNNRRRHNPTPPPTPLPPYGPCRAPNGEPITPINGRCPAVVRNIYDNTTDPLANQASAGYDPWLQASPLVTGNTAQYNSNSSYWSQPTTYNAAYDRSQTYGMSSHDLQNAKRAAQRSGTRFGY